MSTVALLVPLLGSAAFGGLARTVSRRLPPAQATWLLSGGAIVAAFSAAIVLGLVGAVLVGQLPELAHLGRWSSAALHDHAMTEPGVGAAAILALAGAVVAFGAVAVRHGRAVAAAYRQSRTLPSVGSELAVIGDHSREAMALPGRPGRIVVGRSLLCELSPRERRVVLAHERAHLEHGHHWHRGAARLAAAANPMLRPVRGALAYATERAADEAAAEAVGDRHEVARTVARVSLIARAAPVPAGARFADGDVARRVSALLAPAPAPRRVMTTAVVVGLALTAVAAIVLGERTDHLFDLAERLYRAHGG